MPSDTETQNLICNELVKKDVVVNLTYRHLDTGNSLLHEACENNDANKLILWLAEGVDPTHVNKKGKTAIECASEAGLWNCVEIFALTIKDNNGKSCYGSALLDAVKAGRTDVVILLAQAGAKPSWVYRDTKNSCLHIAVLNHDKAMIELLLTVGADPSLKNKKNLMPIESAAGAGLWDCVAAFAQTVKDTRGDFRFGRALLYAVKADMLYVVQLLAQANANLSDIYIHPYFKTEDTCLHLAVKNDNPEMVRVLLQAGAQAWRVDREAKTALEFAKKAGKKDCIAAFLRFADEQLQASSSSSAQITQRLAVSNIGFFQSSANATGEEEISDAVASCGI